jgi:hypothetical protein
MMEWLQGALALTIAVVFLGSWWWSRRKEPTARDLEPMSSQWRSAKDRWRR